MKRREMGKLLLQATDGVAETLTDTILSLLFFYGNSFGKSGSRGVYRAFEEAQRDLDDINYQSIKRAINNLTKARYITRISKPTALELTITKEGKQRISSLCPLYRTSRPWDHHVYIISYDVSSRRNWQRDRLRTYIKKTGGALLQESLWINPYNPKFLLEQFVHEYHIDGTILVSKLGKDGAIGNESLSDLLIRVYHLKEINTKYRQFIDCYQRQAKPPILPMTFCYQSIIRDDPQLPFPLEPSWFLAKRAYEIFSTIQTITEHT